MKKPINLYSLIQSYEKLPKQTFIKLKKYYKFNIKNDEVEQIADMTRFLTCDLSNFYVGYEIPQIGKEFDLLRFGEESILNIETKSTVKDIDSAKNQLIKNKYYLELLGKPLKLFTFIQDTKKIYELDDNNNLIDTTFEELNKDIKFQVIMDILDVDTLFNPSDYLVSPFNNYQSFLENKYFLTQQQKDFRDKILKNKMKYNMIQGTPGTGKTLLLYDLAKKYDINDVAIVHAGILNDGQHYLKQNFGWNILTAADYEKIYDLRPKIIFIDETQRMYPHQLSRIIEYVDEHDIQIIFSIDPVQILSPREKTYKNHIMLKGLEGIESYKLSKKIRSNKEVGAFIKGVFRLNRMHQVVNTNNIHIKYFTNKENASRFVTKMELFNWQFIDHTALNRGNDAEISREMRLNKGPSTHSVVGQEFDKVIVFLNKHFYYNDDKHLKVSKNLYYDPVAMFYQAITRARKEIMIVIYDNPELMSQLIEAIRLE